MIIKDVETKELFMIGELKPGTVVGLHYIDFEESVQDHVPAHFNYYMILNNIDAVNGERYVSVASLLDGNVYDVKEDVVPGNVMDAIVKLKEL